MPHLSSHCTSGSSCLCQFLRLSLFSVTRRVWRSSGRLFWRMSLHWDLTYVSLMIRLGFIVFVRKTTEVKCHFITTYQAYMLSPWQYVEITVDIDLEHRAEMVCVRCLHCEVLCVLPAFHHRLLLGRKSLSTAHMVGSYALPAGGQNIYISCLEFFCKGHLSLLPCLFMQSFICIDIGLIDIYFNFGL